MGHVTPEGLVIESPTASNLVLWAFAEAQRSIPFAILLLEISGSHRVFLFFYKFFIKNLINLEHFSPTKLHFSMNSICTIFRSAETEAVMFMLFFRLWNCF